ncbi:hypothetical protein BDV36DRAFT_294252 [Aspergillus pseudocaelatus]|uniref:Uncharacterized protein n=1 Tax=Aspergillus pseudocaelatus TaxID=1825620 RepID=A0ABQ6WQN1_9EURO|nr:hypothetical protein BDV36DRAFT_294252 [Aspergillus pseudocaelatus]
MPMRWTPENDQLLLLKILETHDLSVDTKKVAEAWPGTDSNSRPTPRAITERLVKMRQMVKAANNGADGHFSIGKGASANPSSATATPRKRGKNATAVPKTPTSGKRKNISKSDDVFGDDRDVHVKEEGEGTPRKEPLSPASAGVNRGYAGVPLKTEPADDDDDDDVLMDEESPSKRVRRASVLPPGMVSTYGEEEDSQTELDSEISEYFPEESNKVEEDFLMAFADQARELNYFAGVDSYNNNYHGNVKHCLVPCPRCKK